jgi:hypothetical protein
MRNTTWGKRRLVNRSKYQPHEGIGEQMRRVGQLLRAGEYVQPDVKALYIDYSIAKAAGQDLSRFRPKPVDTVQNIGYMDATGQSAEDGQRDPAPDSL